MIFNIKFLINVPLLKILASVCLFFLKNNAYALNYAKYSFTYNPQKSECVQVELHTQASDNGEAVFQLPVEVNSFLIEELTAKIYTVDRLKKIFLVKQKPNEQVLLHYQSCFENSKGNPSRILRESVYEKDLLFFEHRRSLVLPLHERKGEAWHYIIDYTQLPENFNIISSYPVINRKVDVIDSFDHFTQSVTCAGIFSSNNLVINGAQDKPVHYVELGNWAWLKEKPEVYIKKILTHQRIFWQDDDFPGYVLILSEAIKTTNFEGVFGTHFNNFATLSITPNKNYYYAFLITLSHELFHGWLGNKSNIKDHTQGLTWFVEGFTDYYGTRFALESGVISLSEYVKYLNSILVRYHNSPIKSLSLEEILKYYRSDSAFYQFELFKGSFLAYKIAALKDSNHHRIIDDIVKNSYFNLRENKAADVNEQKQIVLKQFENVLGKTKWQSYHELLNLNSEINLNEQDFDFPVKIVNKSFKLPRYGFDLAHFMMHKIIKNVQINSPEYRAGLRDGMKVINHNLKFHRLVKQTTIVVEGENETEKTITFNPKTKKQTIPQLKI